MFYLPKTRVVLATLGLAFWRSWPLLFGLAGWGGGLLLNKLFVRLFPGETTLPVKRENAGPPAAPPDPL